jgi:hypothetical protein
MLLTAALAHLFDLPHKNQPQAKYSDANHRALRDVSQCLRDFALVSFSNTFAFRAIQIIRGVADKYALLIQQDVCQEMDTLLNRRTNIGATLPPKFEAWASQPDQQESNSRSRSPALKVEPRRSVTESSYSYSQAPAHPQIYQANSQPQELPTPPQITHHHSQHHQPQSSHHPQPSSLFFTPVDGQLGLPIYNNHHTSTSHMDLHVLLGAVNWPEQLRQDGFEMSDVWGNDPMAGSNQFVGAAPAGPHLYEQGAGMGYAGGYGNPWG